MISVIAHWVFVSIIYISSIFRNPDNREICYTVSVLCYQQQPISWSETWPALIVPFLQIFHGVWTIAFFCLTILDSRARLLPNASCLLAGYLPATTVLHILLIPRSASLLKPPQTKISCLVCCQKTSQFESKYPLYPPLASFCPLFHLLV